MDGHRFTSPPLTSYLNRQIDSSESSSSSPEEQVIRMRSRSKLNSSSSFNSRKIKPNIEDIPYILATQKSPVKNDSSNIANEYFNQLSPTPKKKKMRIVSTDLFAIYSTESFECSGEKESTTSTAVTSTVTANETHASNGLHVRRRLAFRKRLALKKPDTSISPNSLVPTKAKAKTISVANGKGRRI